MIISSESQRLQVRNNSILILKGSWLLLKINTVNSAQVESLGTEEIALT